MPTGTASGCTWRIGPPSGGATTFPRPGIAFRGGAGQRVEGSRGQIAVAGAPEPITVNRYLVQKDRQMQLVMYWFQAQGAVVAGEFEAKIQMVRSAILRNRTDGAIVRISSPVYGSVSETTAELTEYVRLLYPVLGEYLPR